MQGLIKRFGLFGGLGAFAAYAGCCAYMFARQSQLLYQPRPLPVEDYFEDVEEEDQNGHTIVIKKPKNDISFTEKWFGSKTGSHASDSSKFFWHHHPLLADETTLFPQLGLSGWVDNPGQKKAVIYYGGSSELIRSRRIWFTKNAKWQHYTRYFVPYRGFWPNQHLKPSESLLKEDATKLFDLVCSSHDKVFVVGRSLGTSIALHVAANRRVEKLALITPFYSILNLAKQRYKIFPVGKLLRDWHEAHKDAQRVQNKVHVFLAETDEVTPKDSWEQLKQYFTMPFQEQMIPQSDHTNIVEQASLWEGMLDFFERRTFKKSHFKNK